jgi:Fic family protein
VYQPDQPYNNLPLLPPKAELETKATLKACAKAHRALAELKGHLSQIPNPLLMVDAITLQEARLSSEIENIVTTQDNLFKAQADPSVATDLATKEVLSYKQALWHGFNKLKNDGQPFSTRLFVEIVQQIKGGYFDVRTQTDIKIANPVTQDVIYTPPVGEALLRDKLANLEHFLNDDTKDLDPLIKLAVGHYQFEAIHPFADGNGRTGRILNVLYLVDQGLLDWPVLYLSRYIIKTKNEYYRGLRSITEASAWEAWVVYLLAGIEETATQTLQQVKAIVALMEATRQCIKEQYPKLPHHELVELLFAHPYCKVSFLVDKGIAKRETSTQYLKLLAQLGLLEPVKVWREVYYLNSPLITLLKQ